MHGAECVGFVSPHETPSGWRAGPIYVVPEHRGHGHVTAFYREHGDRVWVAFVAEGNEPSRRMHEAAGFCRWKGSRYGTWMRRSPQL
jgi:RimJ/RimL family protein N-acetyltransferase